MGAMNRRDLLVSAGVVALAALGAGAEEAPRPVRGPATKKATTKKAGGVPDGVKWQDVREWGVEGRGFEDTESYYDRLPGRAKGVVRDAVWRLSRETAGMSAHFVSDARAIYLRVELESSIALAAPHMSATCKSGLDLYARLEGGKEPYRWVGTYKPEGVSYAGPLVTGVRAGRRQYVLHLPIYNGVKSLAVGVMGGEALEGVAPRKEKPMLFYGTSVTQGACASRPGMAWVSIVGRRMGRPVLNFGFSGNGTNEIEVGRLLNEIDPAVFVLDCVGNSTAEQVERRVEPLVKLWREGHPGTPILLLERARYADGGVLEQSAAAAEEPKNAALRRAYERLIAAGVKGVHYREGHDFLGTDGEGTVDGSHPNDLGMMRYADAVEGALRGILG